MTPRFGRARRTGLWSESMHAKSGMPPLTPTPQIGLLTALLPYSREFPGIAAMGATKKKNALVIGKPFCENGSIEKADCAESSLLLL